MWRTKLLAFASGLALGLFLFFRFRFLGPGASPLFQFGMVQISYQAALLLGGIGLAGVFRAARLWGPFGISVAPLLCIWGVYERFRRPNPETLGFMPLVFVLTASAPLVGAAIGLVLQRNGIPRFVCWAAIVSSLAAGAVGSGIVRSNVTEARHRREADQIAALLKGVYQAELFYSEGRPGREFTCDGSELPGMSDLGWRSMALFPKIENNETQQFAESVGARWTKANNYAFIFDASKSPDGIILLISCPDEAGPHAFRAFAWSTDPGRKFSIDETGVPAVLGFAADGTR